MANEHANKRIIYLLPFWNKVYRVLGVVVFFSVTNRAHIDSSCIIDMVTLYLTNKEV
mgnify:CR=1 FL=1